MLWRWPVSSAVATLLAPVELVRFYPQTPRADAALTILGQFARGLGHDVTQTTTYAGVSPWLLVWGPGSPVRRAAIDRQVAAGGRAICLDLAYWDRDRKVRVSIDAPHPQRWVMARDWPRDRFLADRVTVSDVWDPTGRVVIAGIGRQARIQYGDIVGQWEADMARRCALRWPDRPVVYRRKQLDAPAPDGVTKVSETLPIERVLEGASLCATWHSNVAVDAIRLGIPVICRDGAAAAVCPSDLGDQDHRPLDPALRERFLSNLSYFQWDPAKEGKAMWAWLRGVLA